MRAHRLSKRSESGFVLVLTLWILAAVAIAAAYFGERVQASLRLAAARQQATEAQLSLASARAEVLYRLGISPLNRQGLGDVPNMIRLDDRPYSESGGVVQLQDAAGLLNLNGPTDDQLLRFLALAGVANAERAPLLDALRDYADVDDLRRLSGAERAQYQSVGRRELPRNAPLLSVGELRDVFGWSAQKMLWQDATWMNLVSISGAPPLNLNTAPWQVIATLAGVTPEAAREVVARRDLDPVDVGWLDRMLGTHYDAVPSPVGAFPSPVIRVTHQVPGQPGGLRYNVELTARGSAAPWRITDFHWLEIDPPSEGPQQRVAAPAASSPLTTAHETKPPQFPPRAAQPASAPNLLAR